MSKYQPLWQAIQNSGEETLMLTFDRAEELAGVPIDHSFLNCKKELLAYGYKIGKISLKQRTISVERMTQDDSCV